MSLPNMSYHQSYPQATPIRHARRGQAVRRLQVVLVVAMLLHGSGGITPGEEAKRDTPWTWSNMVSVGPDGSRTFYGKPVDIRLRNPWPAELEREFQARADRILSDQARIKAPVNTYFENEKRSYGILMSHILNSNDQQALRDIQAEDHQHDQWHRETAGIDYYAAFTLKHQMRKYFYFGDLLVPEYRQRMRTGAQSWTEQDPLRRPHYAYHAGTQGWGPDAKNSWVDVRSTENLFLMRVTSVYLMAEETGNETTRALYKQQILDYARTLYRVGMGEWDSENYHGHSLGPLLNLYDFARDQEVQAAAKACLDWMTVAGAVKYMRGGFGGPTKRDYNHIQPFGGSAACMMWIYFGDAPQDNPHWESDEVHVITSSYRPPHAAVQLARNQMSLPVTIYASKPHYSATTSFDDRSAPEYLETVYLAESFRMGSLAGGTRPGPSDVNGFKLLLADDTDGAVTLQGVPGDDPKFVGSPMYQEGKVAAENRVAQYENIAIWLAADGHAPWTWLLPDNVKLLHANDATVLEFDHTWVVMHPIGSTMLKQHAAKTAEIAEGEKPRFPRHQVLHATGTADKYCGVALEVIERKTYQNDASAFLAELANTRLDVSQLDDGIVIFTGFGDKRLECRWHESPTQLGVLRNGVAHDWLEHQRYLYRTSSADAPLLQSRWQEGELQLTTANSKFTGHIDSAGHATFRCE